MTFNIDKFKQILKKYLTIYNINKLELSGDSLSINIIYNISREKLSKPVYRSFAYSDEIDGHSTDYLENNLDYILQKNRDYRIVSPEKILEISKLRNRLDKDFESTMTDIRRQIAYDDLGHSDEYILHTLSNDISTWNKSKANSIKYTFYIDETTVYVSNLKLHTIEYIDEEKREKVFDEEYYNKLFEIILEIDKYINRLLGLKLKNGNFEIRGKIDSDFLEGMERNSTGIAILNKNSLYDTGKSISIDRDLIDMLDEGKLDLDDTTGLTNMYKSYHKYISNHGDQEIKKERIFYRGNEYEIARVGKDEYLILRLPQRIIVTDNRVIDTIILKYNMLTGKK